MDSISLALNIILFSNEMNPINHVLVTYLFCKICVIQISICIGVFNIDIAENTVVSQHR